MDFDHSIYYWFWFADGWRCCVRGFSGNELLWEIRKHGNLIASWRDGDPPPREYLDCFAAGKSRSADCNKNQITQEA